MKRIIIILVFLVCGISSAQQYFFNGTVYVPKTTVQINAITAPVNGRVEANSDTGSLWYFDGAIWKDTFVGVSSFADLEGDPYDNSNLAAILNSKAADSVVVKTSLDSQIQNLKLAVGDSAWIASKTFGANDIVINTDENPPGGDEFVTDGNLSGAGVLTLNRNYGSPIQIPGFNSGNYVDLTTNQIIGGIKTFTSRVSQTGLGGSTFFGENTGLNDDGTNNNNTAFGYASLRNNVDGNRNIAIGYRALNSNIVGANNVAIGFEALLSNTANSNTAVGYNTLYSNTSGTGNTAVGQEALTSNVTSGSNSAFGVSSLGANTAGTNSAFGYASMLVNTTGSSNSGFGASVLSSNVSGSNNSALGTTALRGNISGSNNVGVGYGAGYYINDGTTDNKAGSNSIFVGRDTKALADGQTNQVVIGYNAIGGGSNTITLGNSSITELRAQVTSITALSDARDKMGVDYIHNALGIVESLNPVIFIWNQRDGGKVGKKATGFLAQELLETQNNSEIGEYLDLVDETNPDRLEARYGHLIPLMVKAIQELQARIIELEKE